MTADELRAAMRKRFEAMTMNEWCRLTGVSKSHLSEFLHGKRGPCSDLLNALNMRVDYVKNRRTKGADQ
jgi:hypothetical protein